MASARRKQGWCGADTSEEGDEDDDHEVGEQRHAVEEVIENLGLRVCPREDQADVTHAISPISLKLSQMFKVIKLFKSPK